MRKAIEGGGLVPRVLELVLAMALGGMVGGVFATLDRPARVVRPVAAADARGPMMDCEQIGREVRQVCWCAVWLADATCQTCSCL